MSSEGYIPVTGGKIWYRMISDNNGIPLLMIHGGPGYAHNYLKPLEKLAMDRPVIVYDQLGCGKSDRPNDPSLWVVDRFREEVHQLQTVLGLGKVHLLGHSWGGLLAVEHTLAFPDTVLSMILASPCLSSSRWMADASRLIKLLPENIRDTIYTHQASGSTQSEEYLLAKKEFERRYLCKLDPLPLPMLESKANLNGVIYEMMWGPSEFFLTGTLKGYDCTNRLPELSCPVLFTCGRNDEATPQTITWYSSFIAKSEVIVFEHSAHMAHLEETESYLKTVQDYLYLIENQ